MACLDSGEDGVLGYAVVARVDDALGLGPALLCCADGGPEDPFSAASSIAVLVRTHEVKL